jgi:hypothetical protein
MHRIPSAVVLYYLMLMPYHQHTWTRWHFLTTCVFPLPRHMWARWGPPSSIPFYSLIHVDLPMLFETCTKFSASTFDINFSLDIKVCRFTVSNAFAFHMKYEVLFIALELQWFNCLPSNKSVVQAVSSWYMSVGFLILGPVHDVQQNENSNRIPKIHVLLLALISYQQRFIFRKVNQQYRYYLLTYLLLTYLLTYLLKLSPCWGAIHWAATQELPSISWNPKV